MHVHIFFFGKKQPVVTFSKALEDQCWPLSYVCSPRKQSDEQTTALQVELNDSSLTWRVCNVTGNGDRDKSKINDGNSLVVSHSKAMNWKRFLTWWRHQMETFSALLAICAGNSPVPGEFPAQRPVTRSFDIFFDLRLNKRLSKQSWGWWFETLLRPLWRRCNDYWPFVREIHMSTLGSHKRSVMEALMF